MPVDRQGRRRTPSEIKSDKKVIKKSVNAGLWQRPADVIKRNAEEDGSDGVGVERLTTSGNVLDRFNPQLSVSKQATEEFKHPEPTTTPEILK